MKEFNLIIVGYGGQGVLSLAKIISDAALKQGYNVKQAELHGLAQRGGSLQCHLRFGEKINSPLIKRADLIISLEAMEALRACSFADENTKIITNSKVFRFNYELDTICDKIKKHTNKLCVVDADNDVRNLTGDIMGVNVYMLGSALKNNILPMEKELIWKALEEKVSKRYLDKNRKVFESSFG